MIAPGMVAFLIPLGSVPEDRFIESREGPVPKFFVTYVGGGMPHDHELMAQARAAFEEWLALAGDAVIDPGAPLRTVARLAAGEPAAEVQISGFSIIDVTDVEAAEELLSTHPFIGRGGTLQVSEFIGV
jgi:hypothetical protein